MPYIRLQVKGTADQIASYKGSNGQIVFCDDATAAKWPGKGQRLFVMNGTTSGGRAVLMSHDLPWGTSDIADNAITTEKIADGNVTTAKLADNAITSAKIKDGEVKTADLADASVTEPKLATDAVTTNKIKNGNVTGPKLADALLGDGLVRDGSSIKVDFSDLPTDKFEALLKGLKMLIPLSGDKSFYVATDLSRKPNAGDTLIDNRGTQDYPFRTIQACVNYVTGNYSVGKYHITIYVDDGVYNENLTLPDFSKGSGYIEIRPWSIPSSDTTKGRNDSYWPVEIHAQQQSSGSKIKGWVINESLGAVWRLTYLKLCRTECAAEQTGGVSGIAQASGTLNLYGCWFYQTLPSGVSELYYTNGQGNIVASEAFTVRLLSAEGADGRVYLRHGYRPHKFTFQSATTASKPNIDVLVAGRKGTFFTTSEYDTRYESPDLYTSNVVQCSGTCRNFALAWQGGTFNTTGTGQHIAFEVPSGSSVTGKRFKIETGSSMTGVNQDPAYFPGQIETDPYNNKVMIDADTYCWYDGITPPWATTTALATCSSNCASALAAHAALPASQAHGNGDDNTGGEQSTSDAEGGN